MNPTVMRELIGRFLYIGEENLSPTDIQEARFAITTKISALTQQLDTIKNEADLLNVLVTAASLRSIHTLLSNEKFLKIFGKVDTGV